MMARRSIDHAPQLTHALLQPADIGHRRLFS
jgi:hypothetical protein